MSGSARADMTSRLRSTLTGHEHGIWSLATAVVDGRPVAVTGSHDETVRIWDLSDGRPVGGPLAGHNGLICNGEVWSLATAMVDGRSAAISGGGSNLIQMWDLATGRHVGEPLDQSIGRTCAVATTVLDRRPVVVTGHADGAVRVWDLATELD
ncbi:WD40 repeat domain-containing protein [Streptomyces sp. NPDC056930]|uniref:WD40 repeat domain-containing protein n=1 Tax=Streptomyces sp. NPDC056930 TaxID=3345967 RepID=UPI0036273C9E